MKRTQRQALLGSALAVVPIIGAVATPPAAHAFDKVWAITSCSAVGVAEKGLWDDMPGAGTNNESGLFWIVTNGPADEHCTAVASGEGVSTTTHIRTAALPEGQTIGEICMTIDDNPNNVASERASALIDDIRIWHNDVYAIGWRERFSRKN
jgi:hypothetical protein